MYFIFYKKTVSSASLLAETKVVPSLCRLHPNSPSHLTRQEADPPETTYPAAPVSD